MDNETHSHDEIEKAEAEKGSAAGPFFLSLFVLAIIGGLVYLPFADDQEPLAGILNSGQWWVPNVGEYHPLILHLPIGIVGLTVFMEICSWLSFGRYRPMTGVALFLAFITGAFACVTGLFDMNVDGLKAEEWSDDMFKHMWMGITFVGVLGLALLAKIWGRHSGSRGPVYGFLLLGAAGVMSYGAHFGGLETHKVDPVENTLRGFGLLGEAEKEEKVEAPVKKLAKDRLAFAEVVLPILDNKCLYCHSEAEGKNKGDLWMDTYENMLVGGESQDEFPTLVPGDAKKSYMIEVMTLPLDDDMHMPPSKKKQMEENEIKLLTWWVNSIPASEKLEDKTLEEMGAPQEVLDAAAMLVSPEERKAMEAEAEAAKATAEAEKLAKREALQNSMDTLKQDAAFKTSLNYASQDSTDLEFTAVSLRSKLDDETFSKLSPVSEALTVVKVGSSSLTEEAVVTQLSKMRNLRKLDLSQTQVGDGVLDAVAGLENLEWLNLYGTQVSDEGIPKLKVLGKLKQLYLWQSKVTEGGPAVEALKKELPGLEVVFGVN